MEALLDEFPFEDNERSCVTLDVRNDFRLPGRRDLLYLVLCTLAKNALMAMRGRPQSRLWLEVDSAPRRRRGAAPGCACATTARASRRKSWPG